MSPARRALSMMKIFFEFYISALSFKLDESAKDIIL